MEEDPSFGTEFTDHEAEVDAVRAIERALSSTPAEQEVESAIRNSEDALEHLMLHDPLISPDDI